jgi:hypothetical protein
MIGFFYSGRISSAKQLPRPATNNLLGFIFLLLFAIYLLGFFIFHFTAFHFGHSIFLNIFFPLIDDYGGGHSMGLLLMQFKKIILITLKNYYPFLLTNILSQWELLVKAFNTPMKQKFSAYQNVIKMHIMILVIAVMSKSGSSNYVLYVVLIFYFFPFSDIMGIRKKEKLNSGPVTNDEKLERID